MLGMNTEILAGWNIYIVWDNARTNDLHYIGMLSSRISLIKQVCYFILVTYITLNGFTCRKMRFNTTVMIIEYC